MEAWSGVKRTLCVCVTGRRDEARGRVCVTHSVCHALGSTCDRSGCSLRPKRALEPGDVIAKLPGVQRTSQ
eukprot:357462-Prymnesium_polylepis.1